VKEGTETGNPAKTTGQQNHRANVGEKGNTLGHVHPHIAQGQDLKEERVGSFLTLITTERRKGACHEGRKLGSQ